MLLSLVEGVGFCLTEGRGVNRLINCIFASTAESVSCFTCDGRGKHGK